MHKAHAAVGFMIAALSGAVAAQEERRAMDVTLVDTTECRAGCQGSTTGCQESWKKAYFAASPGMVLVRSSLAFTRTWTGEGTSPLVKEPQWKITSSPPGDVNPRSLIVEPVVASCEGSNAHKQSRSIYEWKVMQERP